MSPFVELTWDGVCGVWYVDICFRFRDIPGLEWVPPLTNGTGPFDSSGPFDSKEPEGTQIYDRSVLNRDVVSPISNGITDVIQDNVTERMRVVTPPTSRMRCRCVRQYE